MRCLSAVPGWPAMLRERGPRCRCAPVFKSSPGGASTTTELRVNPHPTDVEHGISSKTQTWESPVDITGFWIRLGPLFPSDPARPLPPPPPAQTHPAVQLHGFLYQDAYPRLITHLFPLDLFLPPQVDNSTGSYPAYTYLRLGRHKPAHQEVQTNNRQSDPGYSDQEKETPKPQNQGNPPPYISSRVDSRQENGGGPTPFGRDNGFHSRVSRRLAHATRANTSPTTPGGRRRPGSADGPEEDGHHAHHPGRRGEQQQ